ncbi:IS21 family transposase [Cellulomonas sp. PSBB021]|uniref:IS21 family transposase n=1 Tax=Cellulomonas sp. PSBB021 TaxID=2003551 RepID=UPI000B8D21AE|nr:IS21 family transposase [Cellulomonas sp. PSBB021]ASR55634.1 IS21 family transposase [Cellulomonas sp. PSBB021]ASR56457.1 IS21 family transposase [Cellulomonas sp. PSBB021]
MITVEDWAEIRRLHRAEGLGIKTIARRLGIARNTVRVALAAHEPPKYHRKPAGSAVDAFEPAIRELLGQFPDMPATVIGERVGWTGSSSVLRARVALLRPLFRGADPADRTTYAAGHIVQCDLWFPAKVIPDGAGAWIAPPVLTMVAAYSRFVMAVMLPSRLSGDLLAGMWQLLAGLGAVPKTLVWDNEAGIGQHKRLTLPARTFAGTLGTRIYQTAARDPEAKGVVERANQYLQTSFMPGRSFTGGVDFNAQLAAWLPRANERKVRATGARPVDLLGADLAAMGALPPVAPTSAPPLRVRLARDYYVRVAGNDYSVDPQVIGRFVDIHPGLDRVMVTCAGQVVADHARSWASRQVITDPAHVAAAAELRTAFKDRCAATRGPVTATDVGLRELSDYDEMFALPVPAPRPNLQVVR